LQKLLPPDMVTIETAGSSRTFHSFWNSD